MAIGHGTHDPVISVEFGRDARDRLTEAGADVTYRESPMPHTIDPAFLRELPSWLPARARLSRGGTAVAAGRVARGRTARSRRSAWRSWARPPARGRRCHRRALGRGAAMTAIRFGSAAGGASIRCCRQSAKSCISRLEMSWIIPPRPKRARRPVIVKSVSTSTRVSVALLAHAC